jgi:hypothetical protein
VLDDGTYDAIVLEASRDESDGAVVVELTVLAGEHKGEVVSLRSANWEGDAVELLGVPATVTVADGVPEVRFEP